MSSNINVALFSNDHTPFVIVVHQHANDPVLVGHTERMTWKSTLQMVRRALEQLFKEKVRYADLMVMGMPTNTMAEGVELFNKHYGQGKLHCILLSKTGYKLSRGGVIEDESSPGTSKKP